MRLYLDVCSLCRPYDDLGIDRNRLEAEAVLAILGRIGHEQHQLVASEIIDRELDSCTDVAKVELVKQSLLLAREHVRVDAAHVIRARAIEALGIRKLDAFHLACAEAARCDMLLTTDDRLIRKAAAVRGSLGIEVTNPLRFVLEVDR